MNKSNLYNNLSKDELIALLRQKDQLLEQERVLKTENAIQQAQKADEELQKAKQEARLARQDAQQAQEQARLARQDANQAQEHLHKALEETQSLSYKFKSLSVLYINAVKAVNEQAQMINKNIIILDDFLSLDICAQAEQLISNHLQWIKDAKSWLKNTPFGGKGKDIDTKDLKNIQDENAQAQQELIKTSASLNENLTKLRTLHKTFTKGLKRITQGQGNNNELANAANQIDKIKPRQSKAKTSGQNNGRKARKDKYITRLSKTCSNNCCHKCGGKTQNPVELKQKLLAQINSSSEILQATENVYDVCMCSKCGHINTVIDEQQDLPIVPNREISIDFVLGLTQGTYMGSPLNRITAAIKDVYHIGNDTMYYSMHDYVNIYLKPLYQFIKTQAQNSEVIVCDETTFDCLDSQGRNQIKKHKSKNKQHNNSTSNQDDNLDNSPCEQKRLVNYLLAISSAPHAQVPFNLYSYINSRSTDAIASVITQDFKFKTLVADAYSGYDNLLKEHPDSKIQRCLIHFRRRVIQAYNPNFFIAQLEQLNEQEQEQWIDEQIKNQTPRFILYLVYRAISKIYAIEASIDYSRDDYKEQIQQERLLSRQLIEQIDICMASLSKNRIKLNKTGTKWIACNKSDAYADVCVYYANQKEQFKTFLDEPMVPPDSNMVEASIRPITMLRRSIFFKRSKEYMQDLAIIFTVYGTLSRYLPLIEINDYLRDYSRELYIHCYEKGLTKWVAEGNLINKRINSWDMEALSSDFDFSKWDITKQIPLKA